MFINSLLIFILCLANFSIALLLPIVYRAAPGRIAKLLMNKAPARTGSRKNMVATISRIFLANYQLYILMLPAIIATFIFAYLPMYGVQIAFKNFRTSLGIWGSEWVGLDHLKRFINFPGFWPMIRNTLVISLYSLGLFPLGVIVSLLINEIRSTKFKKTVQMVSYAPHFLSTVVVCGMIILFLGRANGVVNNVIAFFGGERIDFMANPSMFPHIYVWSGVWQSLGWGTIIYLAALTNVSQELVEAAVIDGAGRVKIIWHVNIPAILPTMIILLILDTGHLLSIGYEKILLLTNELNYEASRVIPVYIYQIGMVEGQFSYSAMIGLLNNVVNLLIIVMVNAISVKVTEVSLW